MKQAAGELFDLAVHMLRLKSDGFKFYPNGIGLPQTVQRGVDMLAQQNDVAPLAHIHRDGQRRHTGIADDGRWGIDGTAVHSGNILQHHQIATGWNLDNGLPDRLQGVETARRFQYYLLVASVYLPARGDNIARFKGLLQLNGRQADLP